MADCGHTARIRHADSLGSWQLQRLQWKNQLIDQFEARTAAPAVSPPLADSLTADSEFTRLALVGEFRHDQEIYLTGRTYEGNAGFHVVTPFLLADGRTILINRGWVAESYRDRSTREFSLVAGQVTVDAILRLPASKGYFVPENDPEAGFWFTLVPSKLLIMWASRRRSSPAIMLMRCVRQRL